MLKAVGYQSAAPLLTESAKLTGRIMLPEIVTGQGHAPGSSYNNDRACITGRIDNVRNNVTPAAKYTRYAMEYAELMVGDQAAKGVPYYADEVFELQSKPRQRQRALVARSWLAFPHTRLRVRAFQKQHELERFKNLSLLKFLGRGKSGRRGENPKAPDKPTGGRPEHGLLGDTEVCAEELDRGATRSDASGSNHMDAGQGPPT